MPFASPSQLQSAPGALCRQARLFCQHASLLTLFFLGADPSADGREVVCLFYNLNGTFEILFYNVFYEVWNLDVDWTTFNAGWFLAI